jgi:oligogalacturonide transport system permease protein
MSRAGYSLSSARAERWVLQILMIVLTVIFLYPLIWLLLGSFKVNSEIFSSTRLIPERFVLSGWLDGWRGSGQYSFGRYLVNTVLIVAPVMILTVASSTLVAYGFARFAFPLKAVLFALMISTLMLPNAVVMIPRYVLFTRFGWLDTYLPFYALAAFAVNPFFTFLLVQFFRGIPRELDEATMMDGGGRFRILVSVVVPLSTAALTAVALFQFVWQWNNFLDYLIYISSVKKYPIQLGLRLALDLEGTVNWNRVIAMSVLSMLPCVIVFFIAQKRFVQGITWSGLKA